MDLNLIIIILLALIFGFLFFIEDFVPKIHFKLNKSFIAGISIAYFFLILLPEIAEGLPEFPFQLRIFEFLFILIGFIFIHVSEKLILQKVESKSQKRVRKLMKMEDNLELVSGNMESILETVLQKNPNVRIVINAVLLETVAEVMNVILNKQLKAEEILQISISKARTAGKHHLMMGQNPVTIIVIA